MDLITVDFETTYGPDYTLSKMTTSDYVTDLRFEVILVAVKVNHGATRWFSGTMKHTKEWLSQFNIGENALLAHNMSFDGLILQHHFGLIPKLYLDTRLMAQAKYKPYTGSASLKNCMAYADLGLEKGDEVHNMFGRSRASLSREELEKYAQYCCNDVDCTLALFDQLKLDYPRDEYKVIDLTLRMYLEPVFELDAQVLATHLQEVRARKEALLARVMSVCTTDDLMSNQKFAKLLESYGVPPPMKISLTTGKPTYAFAKADIAWKNFVEEYEGDELVSALCAARTGVKSTLEETRSQRLLTMANTDPRLRVPLLYYAAHTGRYGGCLVADTAVTVYNILYGVETKRLVDVLLDDLVWDGLEFVPHAGVKMSGFSEVIEHDGITGTEDHVVFTNAGEISLRAAQLGSHSLTLGCDPSSDAVDAARELARGREKAASI